MTPTLFARVFVSAAARAAPVAVGFLLPGAAAGSGSLTNKPTKGRTQ
jgi:hypothetical protein